MSKPVSHDAWRIAQIIHKHWDHEPCCPTCFATAAIIDDELQLPQRNAALLLAQGVSDAYENWDGSVDRGGLDDSIENLREALTRIKK
jgi:hypothetical protein